MLSKRIVHLLQVIDAALSEDLSLDELSGRVQLSKFHLHRLFRQSTGITLHDYTSRLRIKRAANRLAFRPALKVIDIGLECGFESAESFSRAFKSAMKVTPMQFRQSPEWDGYHELLLPIINVEKMRVKSMSQQYSVEVKQCAAVNTALWLHTGEPAKLQTTLSQFIDWRRNNRLPPAKSRTFNILYTDPSSVPAEEFKMGLAAEIPQNFQLDHPQVAKLEIPFGRYAKLRHIGTDALLEPAIRYLYTEWLSSSDEQLAEFPLFLERVQFYPDVPAAKSVTDIYLPLV